MNRIKFITLTLLILCAAMFTVCSNLKSPVKMPKILFVYKYNFEYENLYIMSYIDVEGNIYTIQPTEELIITEMYKDLELSTDQIVGQVDKEQLEKMYQLFLRVPLESGKAENTTYFSQGLNMEMGKHKWYGLRYDKKKNIETIRLDAEGNSGYRNQHEKAEEISDWLKYVLKTGPIYE